jgi:hypothetical protein
MFLVNNESGDPRPMTLQSISSSLKETMNPKDIMQDVSYWKIIPSRQKLTACVWTSRLKAKIFRFISKLKSEDLIALESLFFRLFCVNLILKPRTQIVQI